MRITAILLLLVASICIVRSVGTVTKITVERYCNQKENAAYTCPMSDRIGEKEYNIGCNAFNDLCGVKIIPFLKIEQNTTHPNNFIATVYSDSNCNNAVTLFPTLSNDCGVCTFLPTTDSYLSIQCPQTQTSSEEKDSSSSNDSIKSSNVVLLFTIIVAIIASLI